MKTILAENKKCKIIRPFRQCPYCLKLQSQLPRHILSKHKTNPEVIVLANAGPKKII
jgi:hypothetical protein